MAKTYKGKMFPNIEDLENWHGKALGDRAADVIKVKKKATKTLTNYLFSSADYLLSLMNIKMFKKYNFILILFPALDFLA